MLILSFVWRFFLIAINSLSFSYSSGLQIFRDFNFKIDNGCIFGLLGPNGAGKTTLISLITGLYTPQAGKILIDGKSYSKDRWDILQKISVVPQEYAFYTQLSAFENLQFFSRMYPRNRCSSRRIQNAIRVTGLEAHQHRLVKNFSGGLKRRLNLSIGLLNKPELLILDEPTVGIDPQSRRFILEAIRRLNQQGTTILYTSHYMDEVEKICNQIAIIDHGKILASGAIDELLASGSEINICIREKCLTENSNQELFIFLSENCMNISNNIISGHLTSNKQISDLIILLVELNIQIESMHYGHQTLEELFFRLIKKQLR